LALREITSEKNSIQKEEGIMIKHLLGLASISLLAIGAVGCGEQVQGEYLGKFVVKRDSCSSSNPGDVFDASVIMRISSKNARFVINRMEASRPSSTDIAELFLGQTLEADKDDQNRITTYDAIYELSDSEQDRILNKVSDRNLSQEEIDRLGQAVVTVEGDLGTDRSSINYLRIEMDRWIVNDSVSGTGLEQCTAIIETDQSGLILNK